MDSAAIRPALRGECFSSAPLRSAFRTTVRAFSLAAFLAAATASAAPLGEPEPASGRASPFVPIAGEPPPTLTVEAPLGGPLRRGAAIIPYRTENFRILPIFGAGAADVSPRAGHLHVTVDNLPWRWADTGDNGAVVIVGLPPGAHQVRIELATPEHKILAGRSITFTIPADAGP